MSISGSSLLKDGTVSTTGGTEKSFTSYGNSTDRHPVGFDGSDYLSRSEIDFTVKRPKVSASAPNGYTQARSIATLKTPLVLDNGNSTICTLQISFSSDVEMTDAEKQTMLVYGAQLLHDTDFSEFWKSQSVA